MDPIYLPMAGENNVASPEMKGFDHASAGAKNK
jgi:hypothetical protein